MTKLYIHLFSIVLLISLPLCVKADIFHAMGNILQQQLLELKQQREYQQSLPQIEKLNQRSLTELQRQLDAMTGSHGYGNLNADYTLQSWGKEVTSWENLLKNYHKGTNLSEVSGLMNQLSKEFPLKESLLSSSDAQSQHNNQYYLLQAKTALASRAASQYSFDNIEKEIAYQHNLQGQIDNAASLKDAVDLNNRLQVENNLIQLEVVRLLALSNQQQAIQAQADTNAVVSNTQFLSPRIR